MPSLERIYLVGMPASGKSTLGRHLAELLGYECIDLDKLIEIQEDSTIPDLFAKHGEDYFRRAEQRVLQQTFHLQRKVVATGGGTPCFFDNMTQLKVYGTVIFLSVTPQELAVRIQRQQHIQRPLFQEKTLEELTLQLEEKLKERIVFYKQADMMVSAESQNARQLAEYLRDFFKKWY
jgi:shikimate kinase